MELEDSKAVVRDFWHKVFNEGNLDMADELFAPDHVLYISGLERDETGPEAIKTLVALPRKLSRNTIQITVEDCLAEGEKVVTRWTATGTLADEIMRGSDYDNDKITASGVAIYRVSGGLIRHTLWLFEARVDGPQRPFRDDGVREFVLMPEDLPEEYARPMCCFWTLCHCTK